MNFEDSRNEGPEPGSNTPVYSLSIASQLSGIPAHSIRQYIDKGLLVPYTLESGRHLFSALDVCRLKNIQILIREKGLNFAGIKALISMTPCWYMKNCSRKERMVCDAYNDDSVPCWEASHKGISCKNEDCRECPVYQSLNDTTDFKEKLRDLL
jgi:MerR family transcriptional regulator/heat shock protein HspR